MNQHDSCRILQPMTDQELRIYLHTVSKRLPHLTWEDEQEQRKVLATLTEVFNLRLEKTKHEERVESWKKAYFTLEEAARAVATDYKDRLQNASGHTDPAAVKIKKTLLNRLDNALAVLATLMCTKRVGPKPDDLLGRRLY